jgi:hypothetical protein
MSSAVLSFRPRRSARPLAPTEERERWVQRRFIAAWGLLVLDVLQFAPGQSVIPIPTRVGQVITQGALPVALLLALTLNRRVVVRPNLFLFLVSLLVIEAIVTAMYAQYLRGTVYRTFRLGEFVAVLWLLSPYWGRRDLLLVRCHIKVMLVVLGSVVLGLFVAPGHAFQAGELDGAIWPMPPPQVAHYAAITTGLVVVLWLCGYQSGRTALVISGAAVVILILAHTRTAVVGLIAGLLVAGLSLIVAKARVRRLFAISGAIVGIAIMTLSRVIINWLARGQSSTQLRDLSGRTKFWGPILAIPRDKFQEILGFGLSNASSGGLPIDSNWIASYQEQGLFGVAICATILLFLLVTAYFTPRGVQRALALFLVTYCLVASFTEVGFTDASPYMLDLAVAASVLVPAVVGRSQA